MRHLMCVLLVACGARTELLDMSPDGSHIPGDASQDTTQETSPERDSAIQDSDPCGLMIIPPCCHDKERYSFCGQLHWCSLEPLPALCNGPICGGTTCSDQ